MTLYYEAVEVGQLLPTYERRTDLMNWNRFAAVNDEFVHVHMDDEAAKARGEKGVLGITFKTETAIVCNCISLDRV